MQITELIGSSQQIYWGMTSVQFFFMIQVSAACVALAAAHRAFALKSLEPFASFGLILGLSLALVAPLNLILELEQPARFASMLYRTHISSPLSWGVFTILGYTALAALFALATLRGALQRRDKHHLDPLSRLIAGGAPLGERTLKTLAGLALVGAVAVFLYSSMDLAAVGARDLWHASIVPIVFACSALAAAAALVALFEGMTRGVTGERAVLLRDWITLFLALELVVQALWFLIDFVFGNDVGRLAFDSILNAGFENFIVLGLGATILLPLALLCLAGHSRAALAGASLLTLAGAYLVRWNVVVTGQQIPRTGVGVTPYDLGAWAHGGLMQALAPLALWAAFMIAITWTTPWKLAFGQQREG